MRGEAMRGVKTLVVKVGTAILTDPLGAGLDRRRMEGIVEGICWAWDKGIRTVLVSSGAIGAGMSKLGVRKRPSSLNKLQALAAIGQGILIGSYMEMFESRGRLAAQILLTQDDFTDRRRYINAKNTIDELLMAGITPIINENDAIAVEEIRFGDNDNLSALVANMVKADLLLILSDVDGLYEADPKKDPNANLISIVNEITPELERISKGPGSEVGSGGMSSKVEAVKKVVLSGGMAVIANGKLDGVIRRVLEGEEIGTLFFPKGARLTGRKRWIAFGRNPKGSITVDDGAVEAITRRGKSLLPSGVVRVDGRFGIGDLVIVRDLGGREIARGLVNYSSEEVDRIKGHKVAEIESMLGYKYRNEVIHRDNLVLMARDHGKGEDRIGR
jgi:glutamate 5-kinase